MITNYRGGGTDGANRQVNCAIPEKLLYAARYQNCYMDRESADRTGRSIDRFIKSEMIVSRGFVASARKVFGDGYNAIIRNLTREYEKQIIKYTAGNTNPTGMTDVERSCLRFGRGVSAHDTKVRRVKGKLILTTKHCRHQLGKDVGKKIGISATSVYIVGILTTDLVRNLIGRIGSGRSADACAYDKTRKFIIRFYLMENLSWQQRKF